MKLATSRLKQIIKEEIAVIREERQMSRRAALRLGGLGAAAIASGAATAKEAAAGEAATSGWSEDQLDAMFDRFANDIQDINTQIAKLWRAQGVGMDARVPKRDLAE
jgi:hypothetical protein